MKRLWIACCIILFYTNAYSQSVARDSGIIHCIFPVEIEPQYLGGQDAWIKFIKKNFRHPKKVPDTNGMVILSFNVQADGCLTDFAVMKSLQPEYDKEAIRVVKLSSPWKPAVTNGKKVKSRYSLPISINSALKTDTTIYEAVDQSPQFPGGDAEMGKYFSKNFKVLGHEALQSKFIFQFVIEKDGSITNCRLANPISPSTDKEAVHVMKAMPKWTPGTINGKKVRVKYSVPINVDYAEE